MPSYRELAEHVLAAWNRQDFEAWLEYFDPAIEYHTSGLFAGMKAVYRGHAEMAAYWRAIHEPWESLRIEMQRFAEGDDWAILEFRFRATGAESGADVDMTFCNAARIRDGLITHLYARRDFDEAVAALND